MLNAIETRETLRAEYMADVRKSDERLDELHKQDLAIEASLDKYFDHQVKLRVMLDEVQSERINNGVYDGLHLYDEARETVQSDYNKLENALTTTQEEIKVERRSIVKQKEDLEQEYNRAIKELEEETVK